MPNPVLVTIHTQADGEVLIKLPDESTIRLMAPVMNHALKIDVEYSVLVWPMAGIHHVILMRVFRKALDERRRVVGF